MQQVFYKISEKLYQQAAAAQGAQGGAQGFDPNNFQGAQGGFNGGAQQPDNNGYTDAGYTDANFTDAN